MLLSNRFVGNRSQSLLHRLRVSLALLLLGAGTIASAQTAMLDAGFGTAGVVKKLGNRGGSVLLGLNDGGYLLAGYSRVDSSGHLALNRFLADGSVDGSYGSGGTVLAFSYNTLAPPTFEAGIVVDDGKGVIVGGRLVGEDRSLQLHRINTDGSIDNSFVATDPAPGKFCYGTAIKRLAGGKLLIAALLDRGSDPGSDTNFAVLRYLDNGTLDTGFGIGGIAETSFSSGQDRPFALALQSDGSIVLAGWTPRASGSAFAVARFSADGELDTSFGVAGRLTPFIASNTEFAHAVAVQADGKIVVAGSTSTNGSSHAMARLLPNGDFDASFGNGGRLVYRIGMRSEAKSLGIAGDGSLYAGGYVFDADGGEYLALSRVSADGSWDSSFGGGGRVAGAFPATVANRDLLQEGGKIVIGGTWADEDGIAGIGMIRVVMATDQLFANGFETP